jgi:hypothetical protein
MAQQLIAQGEAKRPTASGHWLGSEVFYDPDEGFYSLRLHARTYDGIKVESSYSTDEIRLEAETREAVDAEVTRHFHTFARIYITQVDLDALAAEKR